jgi:hypothetical protein
MSFEIVTIPPIVYSGVSLLPPDLDCLDIGRIRRDHPMQHDVQYVIDGDIFTYYPTDILTVLYDLYQEWLLATQRKSHDMTLCGYTVLEIQYSGEVARFFDPGARAKGGVSPVGEEMDAAYIEKKFADVVATVWGFVLSISNGEAGNL